MSAGANQASTQSPIIEITPAEVTEAQNTPGPSQTKTTTGSSKDLNPKIEKKEKSNEKALN